MSSIEIQMLPADASELITEMEHITKIVNHVYAASESGLWLEGTVRTTVEEVATFTRSLELAVARSMGQTIGCVRVRQIDSEIGEFGMLAVDVAYQGKGIGRALIQFAEEKCKQENLRKMQLELLVPEDGSHPDKKILEEWYTRIGYQPVYTDSVATLFPHLVDQLAIPCKFIVFQKNLK